MKHAFVSNGWAHLPPSHKSNVHESKSCVHGVPSGAGVVVQPPAPSHVDVAWQSPGVHEYVVPPHAPAVQMSFVVHALPSLQAAPLALIGVEQAPVAGSQVPARWHWSSAVQITPPHRSTRTNCPLDSTPFTTTQAM
jgi:hypothetical protein